MLALKCLEKFYANVAGIAKALEAETQKAAEKLVEAEVQKAAEKSAKPRAKREEEARQPSCLQRR